MRKDQITPIKFGIIIIILLFMLSGCAKNQQTTVKTDPPNQNANEANQQAPGLLRGDAKDGFKAAIKSDHARISIIMGGLKKLNSSANPQITLGKVMGSIEATTFAPNYEYQRLARNENIDVNIKHQLIGPGVLATLQRTYDILDHVYQDILTPYLPYLTGSGEMTVDQEKAVAKMKELMFQVEQIYGQLASNQEITRQKEQALIRQLGKVQNELMTIYFPGGSKTK